MSLLNFVFGGLLSVLPDRSLETSTAAMSSHLHEQIEVAKESIHEKVDAVKKNLQHALESVSDGLSSFQEKMEQPAGE